MNPEQTAIVIVGTGFAGIGMAIRLKKAGLHDFVILEKAAEVGGTWRENHYPGAACDVPSPVYSFSFESNPNWSRVFSPQKEILEYLKHCADKYDLRRHIRFHSPVEAASYDEASGTWLVDLGSGNSLRCRFLILGSGGLSRPAYPAIPGLKDFQGALFHTAAWQHDVPLAGKRIGVIGTGASAIQVVPELMKVARQLKLFQRTAAWVLPKEDRPIRFKSRVVQWVLRKSLYWIFEMRAMALLKPQLMRRAQKMAEDYLIEEIQDPALRQKLTPSYIMGCKRVLLSNDFYSSLVQTKADLVTAGIEAITPQGIRTRDGEHHELDAIVCATGFQVAEATAPFRIVGKSGQVLSDIWKEGAQAYLGSTISGFPNLFMIVGPNTGLGHNSIVFIIESQIRYIMGGIHLALKRGLKSLEVKAEVQDRYNTKLQARFAGTVWTRDNCHSWYQTPSGKNTTLWPGFSFEFRLRTLHFDGASYDSRQLIEDGSLNVLKPAC